ncbi:MAG: hypothetical protein EOO89_15250, partial [Pedobacter sp.]
MKQQKPKQMLEIIDDIITVLRENQELLIATIIICIICFCAFTYVFIQWLEARKAKRENEKKIVLRKERSESSALGNQTKQPSVHPVPIQQPETKLIIETPVSKPSVINRPQEQPRNQGAAQQAKQPNSLSTTGSQKSVSEVKPKPVVN